MRITILREQQTLDTANETMYNPAEHDVEWLRECTPEIFLRLVDLYVTDERFMANIDKHKPGYASFLQQAMHLYCDNLIARCT